MAIEDNRHIILHCSFYESVRKGLFGQLHNIPKLNVSDVDFMSFSNILLFGSSDLDVNSTKIVMKETILFLVSYVGGRPWRLIQIPTLEERRK